MSQIVISPFLKKVVSTTVVSLLVTVSLILTTRVLAQGLGPEEFGIYSLARRFIANIGPLVLLSMGVSLRRYVAMGMGDNDHTRYIFTAVVTVSSLMIVFAAACWVAGDVITYSIFHDKAHTSALYASVVFIGCSSLWVVTSSTLFGLDRVGTANLLQIFIGAVFPLVLACGFAGSGSSSQILLYMGLGHLICLISLIPELGKIRLNKPADLYAPFVTLFKYGAPRVPGDFLFAGLFSIGPFLAAYFGNIKQAGFFVIAQYVFRVMESAISAFGKVALPKIASLIVQKKFEFLSAQIERLMVMIFHVGLFVTIHLSFWIREIVLVWLGPEYSECILIMRILIVSVSPYLAYVLLRSVVDAIEVKAVNTMNLFVSLGLSAAVSFVLYYLGFKITGLAVGSAVGFGALGILTGLFLIRRYRFSLSGFLIWPAILSNFVFALLVFLFKSFLAEKMDVAYLVAAGFCFEIFLFLGYLYYLSTLRVDWLLEIKRRIIKTGGARANAG